MPKDPRTRAFLIHLAAYVAVTAICATVNLWLNPDNLWFVWVLLGWGIGVAAHGLALLLRTTHRRERIFVDPKARGFTVHLFAYVAVIVLLFVVNLTATPKVWWFYWVALGWGAGVAFHAWCAFFRKHEPGERVARRRLLRRRREPLIEIVGEPQPAKPAAKRNPSTVKRRATPRKKPATSRKTPKA